MITLPVSSALLLVDLQSGSEMFKTFPHSVAEVMGKARELADAFRASGRRVIFVRVGYGRGNELQNRVPADADMSFSPPEGWDSPDPRLGNHASDIVVNKHAFSAFHGTDLDLILRRLGVTTLVVGGIATHGGVEATARAANDHGYAQLLVEDAMASMSPDLHRFPVENVFPMLGRVVSTAQVLAGFDAQ
ncbi:isochorismatase family protein [Nocardioides sp. Bht2]|uniref:isochorismatase family protein n=1 Tax=Nocardioides sp. Bht2 TaxID=3392297 RepID=UPI0039B4AF7F